MASLALSFYISNSTIYYKYLVLRLILFTSKGIIILIKNTYFIARISVWDTIVKIILCFSYYKCHRTYEVYRQRHSVKDEE